MDYSRYTDLKVRRLEPGILELVMGEEGAKLSTATARLHRELADIWLDVDRDGGARYAPHTESGFRAPANKTILLLGNGYMAKRYASINDQPIREEDRILRWERA